MIAVVAVVALVLAVYGIVDTWKLRRHTRQAFSEVADIFEHMVRGRR